MMFAGIYSSKIRSAAIHTHTITSATGFPFLKDILIMP
jgi:hypothetical protein